MSRRQDAEEKKKRNTAQVGFTSAVELWSAS